MLAPRSLAALAFTCALLSCGRPEPAPAALPEPPAMPATVPDAGPEPGGEAPRRAPEPEAPADPEPAPEPAIDPALVEVPPLDAEATAALASFVSLQASIAPEGSVEVHGGDTYDVQLAPRARAALPAVKRASREAARRVIGAGLAAGTRSPKALSILVKKALRDAGAVIDYFGDHRGAQSVGGIVDVTVERPAGHPSKLGVVVVLSLPCGSDGSLYVLEEQPRGAPAVAMAVEANGYASITDGQLALTWRLSPPDAHGGWFAVVARASPWCTSAWRGIDYGVYLPGPSPDAPRRVLHQHDSAYLGWDLCTLDTGADDFTVHYQSWTRFSDDVTRAHVHRYVRQGGAFARAQPIVARPIDLPREWARMPWDEARRYVVGPSPAALQEWHRRLSRKDWEFTARLSVESEDEASGRVRLALTCERCKTLPEKLRIDVRKDGPGWAMEAIAPAP